MKNLLLACFFASLPGAFLGAQSQEKAAPVLSDTFAIGAELAVPERVVYDLYAIEKPPVFPGGEKALLRFLAEHLDYRSSIPKDYQGAGGTVVVSFIIESDGSISTKQVLRIPELAEPVLKMLDLMPRWEAGMKNGQRVAVRWILPVRVHID